MKNVVEGKLKADGIKIAVIGGRFNEFITSKLIGGGEDCYLRHGGNEKDLTLFWVPGAYEIPILAQKLAETGKYDAIVCLGAVIRGATSHFDYVCAEAAKGIATASMKTGVPIMFGILTTDTIEQAIERAGTKAGNKGWDSMMGAIEMVNLFKQV